MGFSWNQFDIAAPEEDGPTWDADAANAYIRGLTRQGNNLIDPKTGQGVLVSNSNGIRGGFDVQDPANTKNFLITPEEKAAGNFATPATRQLDAMAQGVGIKPGDPYPAPTWGGATNDYYWRDVAKTKATYNSLVKQVAYEQQAGADPWKAPLSFGDFSRRAALSAPAGYYDTEEDAKIQFSQMGDMTPEENEAWRRAAKVTPESLMAPEQLAAFKTYLGNQRLHMGAQFAADDAGDGLLGAGKWADAGLAAVLSYLGGPIIGNALGMGATVGGAVTGAGVNSFMGKDPLMGAMWGGLGGYMSGPSGVDLGAAEDAAAGAGMRGLDAGGNTLAGYTGTLTDVPVGELLPGQQGYQEPVTYTPTQGSTFDSAVSDVLPADAVGAPITPMPPASNTAIPGFDIANPGTWGGDPAATTNTAATGTGTPSVWNQIAGAGTTALNAIKAAGPAIQGAQGALAIGSALFGQGGLLAGTGGSSGTINPQQAAQQADPWASSRPMYIDQLNQLMANPSLSMSTPGYQFRRDQGEQALQRNYAKGGQNVSGNAAMGLSAWNQNYAAGQYGDQVARLSGLAGAGQNPAAGTSAQLAANQQNIGQTASSWKSLGQGIGTVQQALSPAITPQASPQMSFSDQLAQYAQQQAALQQAQQVPLGYSNPAFWQNQSPDAQNFGFGSF